MKHLGGISICLGAYEGILGEDLGPSWRQRQPRAVPDLAPGGPPSVLRIPPQFFRKKLVKLYGPHPGYVESFLLRFLDLRFLDSWDHNKISKIFHCSIYGQYFDFEPSLPSTRPSKTLTIESGRSKSSWGLTYTSFGPPGTCFSRDLPRKAMVLSPTLTFIDLI